MPASDISPNMAATFHWADYVIFALSLLATSAIGVVYGAHGRNEQTVEDFFMAGRNMHIFPVAISLVVSFFSAISVLGDPTEVYYHGGNYWLFAISFPLALPLVAHVFAPLYFRAKNISAYQFLKKRFGARMRSFTSSAVGIKMVFILSIALYAPSVALSQMTGINISLCIFGIGGICAFYTSLGGIKAVLWADTVQGFVMIAGLLACLIQGVVSVGGPQKVVDIARAGNRLPFNNFDPNPLVRLSVWSYLIGGFFTTFATFVSTQMFIQRYCMVKSEKDMKFVIYISVPLFGLFISLFTMVGLTMYAYFKDCDPLLDGRIQKADQMVPLMVMETLGHLPGVPGLFLACIISGALSTLSSGQNALAATCLDDIIQPLFRRYRHKDIKPQWTKVVAVALSLLFGVLNIAMAFMVLKLKNTTLFSLTMKTVGTMTGTIAGLFTLAVIFPFVNSSNALVGCFVSIVFLNWLVIGGTVNPPPLISDPRLAVSTRGCNVSGDILWSNKSHVTTQLPDLTVKAFGLNNTYMTERFPVNRLYELNPLYFVVVGCFITVGLALILSGFFCIFQKREHSRKDQETMLVSPEAGPQPQCSAV